ncbi:ABC-type multidrug transport system, ATPase component [Desulfitobacterium dehalogenans ATCC 51507]|uniref:ABC-type multidrug transport system, ATPase component n=1 Tax=Desulfitobacterium dehalogenans (strain ATCC 51507 / DSM 9161 / JW/IU-DC1) TaxID=756499 RepID=I4A652_DESDJ|nr:ABC transporter ATP-binding protein [Desulfitobacterium dehalogenans]AFL99436.1 ABC-type multidrug transport system, ATPase component [Desulfitobacterium dehalogenans ATCC 51507]
MILLENVCKEFDTGFTLKNITLNINHGEKVLVFGPNGAGKTTFLKILSCLITPSSGTLKIMGYPPSMRTKLLGSIGFAPQSGHLYESLTIKQNLEFYGKMYGIDKPELDERINWLLAQFNLTMKLDSKISQLSKGMRQRLLIIKALLHKPQLLLLDEPYSGLDLESSEYLHRFIDSVEDKTVVTATHDFNTEIKEGQRIIIFNQGAIVFDELWQDNIATFKDFYRWKVGQ